METVKVAIGEMTAPQLNWALATLLKHEILIGEADGTVFIKKSYGWQIFCPASSGIQAWPLKENYGISLVCHWPGDPEKKMWQAYIGMWPYFDHKEATMASMMCLASHLTKEATGQWLEFVEIPDIVLMQLKGD